MQENQDQGLRLPLRVTQLQALSLNAHRIAMKGHTRTSDLQQP